MLQQTRLERVAARDVVKTQLQPTQNERSATLASRFSVPPPLLIRLLDSACNSIEFIHCRLEVLLLPCITRDISNLSTSVLLASSASTTNFYLSQPTLTAAFA